MWLWEAKTVVCCEEEHFCCLPQLFWWLLQKEQKSKLLQSQCRHREWMTLKAFFSLLLKTKALISNLAHLALLFHSHPDLLAPLLRFLLMERTATAANFTVQRLKSYGTELLSKSGLFFYMIEILNCVIIVTNSNGLSVTWAIFSSKIVIASTSYGYFLLNKWIYCL